jgi:Resolvase, N terminal domain/Cry35Ab1 HTH C-terminal domain/Phage integrase SAM-like domain
VGSIPAGGAKRSIHRYLSDLHTQDYPFKVLRDKQRFFRKERGVFYLRKNRIDADNFRSFTEIVKVKNVSFDEAINDFFEDRRRVGTRESTIEYYRRELTISRRFILREKDAIISVSDITVDLLDDFIEYLREERGNSVGGINAKIRAIRSFLFFCEELFNRGVRVHVLNMGVIENTPTGRLIFTIMSAFAEFERDLIVERTREGKAIARQRLDFREGRPPKYTKKQIDHALVLLETHSYKQVEEMTGISKSTLIRAKRKREQSAQ